MRITTIQPSAYTDHITGDGHELTKLPYPFHVDERGFVQRQDFWAGRVLKVIGFVPSPESHDLIPWDEIANEPADMVGRYVVTSDDAGTWSTHQLAISAATVMEDSQG